MKKYITITVIPILLGAFIYGYFELSKPTEYINDIQIPTESNESIIQRKAKELASLLLVPDPMVRS